MQFMNQYPQQAQQVMGSTNLKPAAQPTSPNIEIPLVNVNNSYSNKRKSHPVQHSFHDDSHGTTDEDDDDDDEMSALTTETSHSFSARTIRSLHRLSNADDDAKFQSRLEEALTRKREQKAKVKALANARAKVLAKKIVKKEKKNKDY